MSLSVSEHTNGVQQPSLYGRNIFETRRGSTCSSCLYVFLTFYRPRFECCVIILTDKYRLSDKTTTAHTCHLPEQCLVWFWHCPQQRYTVGLSNRNKLCSLRGTNWIYEHNVRQLKCLSVTRYLSRRLATWWETELLIQQNVFLCDVTIACSTLTGRTATWLISRNMFHALIQTAW